MARYPVFKWGVIILALFVGGIGVFLLLRGDNQTVAPSPLRSFLGSERCERACWLGIEPGVTDQTTVNTIFANEDIEFSEVPLPEPENGIYDFMLSDGQNIPGRVTFLERVVNQVLLPLNVCVSQVVAEYGEPAQVETSDLFYYFLYPDIGLIFSVDGRFDATRIATVLIVSDSIIEGYTEGSISPNWSEFEDDFARECDEGIVNLG
jgi:hypothetical protein